MNFISGQTGLKEEQLDETQVEEERLNLSTFVTEWDNAPQTVVSH